jgi:very-short-patch-repair endonuclease/RecB family exonuclease
MQTFLQKTAQYIFDKHSLNDLSRICVVIPSRRGVLYFKQALAKLSDKPFLAPEVLAIDDFVAKITGVKQIDQMSLLFELYDVFKEIDPLVNFERFMTWAPTLLNDFDKIDQYLVEPKALFSYMTEAKALERWQIQLGESQRDKLKKTDRTDRYFKLFENINTVYENLRKNLTERGLVYRGMAYRTLAENVDEYLVAKEPYKKYYIVGFNAMSDAEEKIFKTLIKNKSKAETIWDSDTYYLRTKDQRAGEWLRKYKESGVFGEWQWESEELLKSQKNIQIIGVANASMQAKVAGHIYRNWRKEQTEAVSQNSTIAIVLGDENLLTPVMNSVDEPSLNITMGLSLKSSMLFTLIDALFEMQRNLVEFKNAEGEIIRIPKFSHRHVVKVLNHPFVRRYFVEGGNLTPEVSVAPTPSPSPAERGSQLPITVDGNLVAKPHPPTPSPAERGSKLPTIADVSLSESNSPLSRRGVGGEVSATNFHTTDFATWKKLKPFARENRTKPTPSEELLWQELRGSALAGNKFRRQHVIEDYIVDFVNIENKLVVELDGEIHEVNDNPQYDEFRTMELNELGFRVLRFKNEVIFENIGFVKDEILRYLNDRNLTPPAPSPAERGSKPPTIADGSLSESNSPLSRRGVGGEVSVGLSEEVINPQQNQSESNSPLSRRVGDPHRVGGEVLLQGEEILRFTLNEITQKNKVFLGANELIEMGQNDPLYEILFTHWQRNPKKALKSFYTLIDIFREIYRTSQDAIETEYLYRFYLILQRLEGILDERKDSISFRSFKTFLYELIKQEKIPFESETNEQLQIMGMLETRTLDFEKIIILSVNEGTLPQGKSQNSLVPFDAFKEFGLPTHNHADAVMSYHFFRLLQRAKEVVLLHVLPSDTYGAGEKSRFILQIEHELKKINTNLNVTYPTVSFKSQAPEDEVEAKLEIHKTPEIIEIIEKRITEKGLYPSHLNEFISCSIKYYFSQIAGIAEAEEVSEKIEADTFGNWLHKTLENIDNDLMEQDVMVSQEHLQAVFVKLDTYLDIAFAETNRGLRRDEGQNYITYQVGRKLLKKFFDFQLKHEPFPVQLLGTEKAFNVNFSTQIGGKDLKIKVAGRIDRLDRIDGDKIRVVDYKTGKVELKDLKPSKEQTTYDALMDKDKEKYRQLWLYKYILLKKMESNDIIIGDNIVLKAHENQVMAGIYSFRNIEAGFLTQDVAFNMGESVQDFLQESEKQLVAFATDMLDTSKTFERTNDLETCVYCDFKGICGR